MIRDATATVAYRWNPHLDQEQRGLEAASIFARTLRGEVRPVQAIERPPMLMHISRQFTGEQAQEHRDVAAVMEWPGILSASAAMGFPYADVEEVGASVFWRCRMEMSRWHAELRSGWRAVRGRAAQSLWGRFRLLPMRSGWRRSPRRPRLSFMRYWR